MHTYDKELDAAGFAILAQVLDSDTVRSLINLLHELPAEGSTARKRGSTLYARRSLLDFPEMRELANCQQLRDVVEPVLGSRARAVRGILFNKTADANWLVPWHQDLSIAVQQRIDVDGFGPWSVKAGVLHVQPRTDVLRQMLTIRLHLDDCDVGNGPLKIIPCTHRDLLTTHEMSKRIEAGPVINCTVAAGGAVLMRPLTLHASSPAQHPRQRRIIHLEYAGCDLPGGLRWHAV